MKTIDEMLNELREKLHYAVQIENEGQWPCDEIIKEKVNQEIERQMEVLCKHIYNNLSSYAAIIISDVEEEHEKRGLVQRNHLYIS